MKINFSKIDFKKPSVLIILLCCALAFFAGGILIHLLRGQDSHRYVFQVKPGMSSHEVATQLKQKELISSEFMFLLLAKIEMKADSIKAGDYELTTQMTTFDIIDTLTSGQTIARRITIPEGYTINQIAQLLEDQNLGSAAVFKQLAKSYAPYDYMTTTNPNLLYHAEGFVFPDTYSISSGMTEQQILKMLVGQFDKKVTPEMRRKAAEKGINVYQLTILASLVEREARLGAERPIIAGVFINRLRQNMPLQSCATIQYILGTPKAELSIQDTEINSPYNTYLHDGLPPGPIANPGIAALQAVVDATPTEYLYFVASSNGSHQFSKTYEEHLAAIERAN